jgi:hypothetical protein
MIALTTCCLIGHPQKYYGINVIIISLNLFSKVGMINMLRMDGERSERTQKWKWDKSSTHLMNNSVRIYIRYEELQRIVFLMNIGRVPKVSHIYYLILLSMVIQKFVVNIPHIEK